jgi:hypothetical protein
MVQIILYPVKDSYTIIILHYIKDSYNVIILNRLKESPIKIKV